MLKKIINQIKNISPRLLNVIFFLTTLIVLLIIAFSQFFVDQNYRFLNPKSFLNPGFIVKLFKGSQKSEVKTWEQLKSEGIITFNSFLSPNKDKIASIEKKGNNWVLKVFKTEENETEEKTFDSFISFNIIQWDKDNQRIYLAYQEQESLWQIGVFDNGEIDPLIKNINFKGERLTSSVEPIGNQVIYPQCDPSCSFVAYNLNESNSRSIKAIDETNEENINQLELLFFDEGAGKIIYQINHKEIAYIIDFSSYLWHYLYLRPESENLIEIKGVFVNSQGKKKLVAFSKLKKQVYLYDINDIGLKIIENVDETDF